MINSNVVHDASTSNYTITIQELQHIYLQNKYTKWYYNIINNAQTRTLSENIYTEKHHIIPKSISGDNTKTNIVILTAKEHFICHLLLTKMTIHKKYIHKMQKAIWCMSMGNEYHKRYIIPSRLYENIRTNYALSMRKKGNPMYGKNHSIKSKKQMSIKRKGLTVGKDNPNYGKGLYGVDNPMFNKSHSIESKKKMSLANIGNSYALGCKRSDETRKKSSISAKLSRGDHKIYNWVHEIYGFISCTRYELIEKYSQLDIRNGELSKTIKGIHKHRGWDIIKD